MNRRLAVTAFLLLAISLAVSLLFFHYAREPKVERILFFPGTVSRDLSGEARVMPHFPETSRNVRTLVEEVILGPASIHNSRVMSRETDVDLFILRGRRLYIDLSQDVMLQGPEVNLSIGQGLEALRKTLRYNFPWLEKIVITIGGQLPFEPVALEPHKDQI